jgi:PAS domain S-box-containing protein
LESFAGKTPQELVGKELGDIIENNYSKCVENGNYITYEETLNLKTGIKTWWTTLTLLKECNKVYIVGSSRDISKNKLLESEYKKTNFILDSVIKNSTNPLAVFDTNGRYYFASDSVARLYGLDSKDSLINKTFSQLLPSDKVEGMIENIERVKSSKKSVITKDVINVEGEDRIFQTSIFPVISKENDVDLIGAVSLDITEIEHSKEEIIKAKEEAEIANNAKSQFVANMSHEIRTPLNGILGFLQLIEETSLSDEQREYINDIKYSADVLFGVINDILDMSKIEAGKIELEKIIFYTRSTIESAIIPFATRAKEKGTELNMLMRSDLPQKLIGDPTKLRQIIINLISNAIKFTENGEIFLEVILKEEKEEKIELLFKIKDTGIGMSEDIISKLFKPFAQGDVSSTRKYGGTGLGLSICKSLVEMMNGNITVESDEGTGTTFIFTAIFEKSNIEICSASDLTYYSIFNDKKILVVDNNRMSREIAKIYLKEQDAIVEEASNLTEALTMILRAEDEEDVYDAVLLDSLLPLMAGYDLSKALKAMPLTKNLPLFLITSIAGKEEVKKAKNSSSFSGFLSKPYKKKEFLDCIAEVMSGSKDKETHFVKSHTVRKWKYKRKLKILVVEDNEVNRNFMIKLLQLKEFSCDVAENGLDAVDLCRKNKYDIVFMDCQMPIMDGYEATRKIRGIGLDTVIVAMTAYAMSGDANKCFEAGMNEYISKPINIDNVMRIIEKHNKYNNKVNIYTK